MSIYKVTPYDPKHSEQFEVEAEDVQHAIDEVCTALYDRATIALKVRNDLYLPIAVATGETRGMFHMEKVSDR